MLNVSLLHQRMPLVVISFFIWVNCTEFAALNVVGNFVNSSDIDIFLVKNGIYGPNINMSKLKMADMWRVE